MIEKPSTMIKKLMEYHGLNQAELADKFKWERSQVSRWANDKSTPHGEVLLLLHEEYNKIKDEQPPLLKQLV